MISIIFVHHGQNKERSDLAKESLNSLYNSVKHLPCEIIVVDNGGEIDDSNFFLEAIRSKKINSYIRNSDNLWFGRGRNQAIRISEGEFIAVCDNDLIYKNGWLDQCIEALKETEGHKTLSTPLKVLPCHKKQSRTEAINGKNYLLNTLAGSNCWVMRRNDWLEIGEFEDHHFSGTAWCKKYSRKGYAVIVLNNGLITDMGDKKSNYYGYVPHMIRTKQNVIIEKILTNGDKITYFKKCFPFS